LEDATKHFTEAIENYKRRMEEKFIWDLAFKLGEIVFTVGLAIYSGGATTPLTVGATNKVLCNGSGLVRTTL
jgi:hypothetical protein